jgi:hypothetical protein
MKIDTELRAAVRSTAKVSKTTAYEYRAKSLERTQAQIADFISKPKIAAKLKKAKVLGAQLAKLRDKYSAIMDSLGLNDQSGSSYYTSGYIVSDTNKFRQMSGHDVTAELVTFRYDHVMAELGQAEPSKRGAILKKYGINWE